jgi:hypothetical protein
VLISATGEVPLDGLVRPVRVADEDHALAVDEVVKLLNDESVES